MDNLHRSTRRARPANRTRATRAARAHAASRHALRVRRCCRSRSTSRGGEFTRRARAARWPRSRRQAARTAIESLASLAKAQRHRSSRRRTRADPGAADDARVHRLRAVAVHDRARPHEHRLLRRAGHARLPRHGARRRRRSAAASTSPATSRGCPAARELSSGRLGVMMPVGTGLALGLQGHARRRQPRHLPHRRRRLDLRPGAERLQRAPRSTARRSCS